MLGARTRGTGVYTLVHEDSERASNNADRPHSSAAARRHLPVLLIFQNTEAGATT